MISIDFKNLNLNLTIIAFINQLFEYLINSTHLLSND